MLVSHEDLESPACQHAIKARAEKGSAPTLRFHAAASRAGASDEARLGSKEPPFVWMLVSATVRSQNVLAVRVAEPAHGLAMIGILAYNPPDDAALRCMQPAHGPAVADFLVPPDDEQFAVCSFLLFYALKCFVTTMEGGKHDSFHSSLGLLPAVFLGCRKMLPFLCGTMPFSYKYRYQKAKPMIQSQKFYIRRMSSHKVFP